MLHQAESITGKERNKSHPCSLGSFVAGASSRVWTHTAAAQSHGLGLALCMWWSESTAVKSAEINRGKEQPMTFWLLTVKKISTTIVKRQSTAGEERGKMRVWEHETSLGNA